MFSRYVSSANLKKNKFKHTSQVQSEQFKSTILQMHSEMMDEVYAFTSALENVQKASTDQAINLIGEFEKLKKHKIRKVKRHEKGNISSLEMAFKELKERNEQLKREQLELESETSEDFEELVTHFEIRFDNIRSKLVNKYQEFFRDLETLENAHSESLTNRTAQLIESHGKKSKSDEGDKNVGEDTKKSSGTESSSTQQDDTKEMDENVEILLKDKESLMTSIVTSNDIHVGKLLGVEDEMRERLSKKSKEIVESIHESERERNRSRILDIKHFHQSTLNEIEMTSGDYSS